MSETNRSYPDHKFSNGMVARSSFDYVKDQGIWYEEGQQLIYYKYYGKFLIDGKKVDAEYLMDEDEKGATNAFELAEKVIVNEKRVCKDIFVYVKKQLSRLEIDIKRELRDPLLTADEILRHLKWRKISFENDGTFKVSFEYEGEIQYVLFEVKCVSGRGCVDFGFKCYETEYYDLIDDDYVESNYLDGWVELLSWRDIFKWIIDSFRK